MADFFFNDLSINNQFKDKKVFLEALRYFGDCRTNIMACGHIFFVHRNILNRNVFGVNLRQALLQHCDKKQIVQFLNWVDKSGRFLPDEVTFLPDDTFKHLKEIVNESGIAECAYRCLLDFDAFLTSMANSTFDKSPIKIHTTCCGEEKTVDLLNFYNLPALKKHLVNIQPPITSWQILLDRIKALPSVSLMEDVETELRPEPFATNIADECFRRACALSEMAESKTIEEFNELYKKYCTGDSWFSDSSETEKNDFKKELTFTVNGKKKFCPFHGKVKIRQFRIHIDEVPAFKRQANIAYIGPKRTKV